MRDGERRYSCETCIYFNTGAVGGVCRRNPPKRTKDFSDGLWPGVDPRKDWCGEWRNRNTMETLEDIENGLPN